MKLHALSLNLQWATIAQVSKQIIQIGTTIILAKILSPGDFGIIGLATTLVSFLNLFRDIGTGSAIIKSERIDDTLLSSIFWLNLFIGVLACVLLFFSAWYISIFFKQESLKPVLQLLSLVFILNSFSIVQQALLEKQLQFKKLAKVEIVTAFMGSVTAIVMAYKFQTVLCFPAQILITSGLTSCILFFSASWLPKFIFSLKEIRSIGRYTMGLTGFGLVNYFARNLDNIIIGKFLGVTELGYYSLAYKIILFPIQNISSAINRVMFPALSRLQEENAMREGYLRFLELIAFISFPLMAWIFIMDDLIVKVILGGKWVNIILLIKIFVPIGIIQSLAYTTGTLYMLKSRTGLLFWWGIISTIFIAASFIVGVKWGILGVVISYAIVYLGISYFDFKIPFKLIGLTLYAMIKGLKHPFILSLKMTASVLIIRKALEFVIPGESLIIFSVVSVMSLLIMIFFISRTPALLSFVRGREINQQN